MSNFQASLRALFTKDIPLNALIEKLNERVLSNANGEKFITLFIGRYNSKSHELEYINAGHNPPLMYEMESGNLTLLRNGCVGIGMLDFIPFILKGNEYINGTTKILCFTDGLVELIEGEDVHLATPLLEELLCNTDNIDKNIEQIIEKQSIIEGNPAIFDDITMLGIQINR
jgi:sigma-B regulation protein RsbU (phosphoserine phosphatase)